MNTDFWTMVGAIGQCVSAIGLIAIAFMTYLHTKRQNSIILIKYLTDIVNDHNKICMMEEHKDIVEKMRKPVIGIPEDFIIFNYINYMYTVYVIYKNGLINGALYKAKMENGIAKFSSLEKDKIERLISRGYEPEFKIVFMDFYEKTPK